MSELRHSGLIMKALSGFYYVKCDAGLITCRARGKFRYQKLTPLVGDRVELLQQTDGSGVLECILPRRNEFHRPAVSNIDQLVIIAAGTTPTTEPFLIDRLACAAELCGCEPLICINKWDMAEAETLYETYRNAGFMAIRTSAKTGLGMEELRACLEGRVSAFTGNSGVGKSSLLNALDPSYRIRVGEVSQKLGRGKHTTRHIEIFELPGGGMIADTPGYASLDAESLQLPLKDELQNGFREFAPYLGSCRFLNCVHVKGQGCAVLDAVAAGNIAKSRHESYLRLFEEAKARNPWK